MRISSVVTSVNALQGNVYSLFFTAHVWLEFAWHLELYFWRNFKASDFQFLITRVFIFYHSIIVYGSTFIFYGSNAKWTPGWISNSILYLSKAWWLLPALEAKKLMCWPHRVGKIESMPVAKDEALSVTRRKGSWKANEGSGHAPRKEHSILSPLLRTWVMIVTTGTTCQKGRQCRNYFYPFLLRKRNPTTEQPVPQWGNE